MRYTVPIISGGVWFDYSKEIPDNTPKEEKRTDMDTEHKDTKITITTRCNECKYEFHGLCVCPNCMFEEKENNTKQ